MTADPLITALALPDDARVDQRVSKKLLLEQPVVTAADKRAIQDGIEELLWVAALKPSNIGVPTFRDDTREYLEIAVLLLMLRDMRKTARLVELIHRAIPYPVILATSHPTGSTLSLAHKRFSQARAGEFVVETLECTAPFHPENPSKEEAAFLSSLPASAQPSANLYLLYQGWMDRLTTLAASRITGAFTLHEDPAHYGVRRAALGEHTRIHREISRLRALAAKEKQVNRRVEMNLAIKRLETQLAEAAAKL